VSHPLPIVSVIIAAPPDLVDVKALSAARKLDYPADRLEILVVRGRQPSVQRNVALRAARGEWVYFLDDDALAEPGNLQRAAKLFTDTKVAMIGGPNLCPADAPALEKVFAVVLASWLAFGPSRARYLAVGQTRDVGEKELILCSLLARREDLLRLGGFNEALYPNEENALMDQLRAGGRRLVYDPQFFAWRRPRRTLKAFLKMLRTYGRGRAEQFRLNPTPGSALNFVPPLFCLYLVGLLVAAVFGCGRLPAWLLAGMFLPLAGYSLAVLLQTVASVPTAGIVRSFLALPLVVASHLFYGFGFWRGLFTKLKTGADRSDVPVTLEKIQ